MDALISAMTNGLIREFITSAFVSRNFPKFQTAHGRLKIKYFCGNKFINKMAPRAKSNAHSGNFRQRVKLHDSDIKIRDSKRYIEMNIWVLLQLLLFCILCTTYLNEIQNILSNLKTKLRKIGIVSVHEL